MSKPYKFKVQLCGPEELPSVIDGQEEPEQAHWWRIVSRNGGVLLTSEMYSTKSNAAKAARAHLKHMAAGAWSDEIEDMTE